jgi:hypothetical protein
MADLKQCVPCPFFPLLLSRVPSVLMWAPAPPHSPSSNSSGSSSKPPRGVGHRRFPLDVCRSSGAGWGDRSPLYPASGSSSSDGSSSTAVCMLAACLRNPRRPCRCVHRQAGAGPPLVRQAPTHARQLAAWPPAAAACWPVRGGVRRRRPCESGRGAGLPYCPQTQPPSSQSMRGCTLASTVPACPAPWQSGIRAPCAGGGALLPPRCLTNSGRVRCCAAA